MVLRGKRLPGTHFLIWKTNLSALLDVFMLRRQCGLAKFFGHFHDVPCNVILATVRNVHVQLETLMKFNLVGFRDRFKAGNWCKSQAPSFSFVRRCAPTMGDLHLPFAGNGFQLYCFNFLHSLSSNISTFLLLSLLLCVCVVAVTLVRLRLLVILLSGCFQDFAQLVSNCRWAQDVQRSCLCGYVVAAGSTDGWIGLRTTPCKGFRGRESPGDVARQSIQRGYLQVLEGPHGKCTLFGNRAHWRKRGYGFEPKSQAVLTMYRRIYYRRKFRSQTSDNMDRW
jgi:hypothetical protein